MPPAPVSLLYEVGLTNDVCSACARPLPAGVVANGATVWDVIDVRVEDEARGFLPEEFRIVRVVSNRAAPLKQSLTKAEAGQP